MTTASKPLPPHGSYRRYKGTRTRRPCRCQACTRANRLYGVQRARNILEGRPNRVPRAELVPHIEMLLASGMSQTLIARHADLAQGTISYLLSGRSKTCRRDQALRLLAVRPNSFDGISDRPATGTTRRLRALIALGHTRQAIAAESGLHIATLSFLLNGHWTVVDGRTADAVTLAYKSLGNRPGDCEPNRRRAARLSWGPPAAWDDDTIDDPAAQQDTGQHVPRYVALSEDSLELEAQGYTREHAAERLGVTRDGLQRALQIYRSAYKEAA
ncbi:hypothetical protein OG432_24635 [Streptomyces sp. NBC_00442]|uniref:hypothetical protein n=1 Tax=Streptomyces sp. NBC_00442 TaxID=2903651 RepID=UPI002E215D6A